MRRTRSYAKFLAFALAVSLAFQSVPASAATYWPSKDTSTSKGAPRGTVGDNDKSSIAFGNGAKTTLDAVNNGGDKFAIALGENAEATGGNTVAIGQGTKATNYYSIAIGYKGGAGAPTTGRNAIAIGTETAATGTDSVAIGYTAKARGERSLALGDDAGAWGTNSVALGYGAESTLNANNSVALGQNSLANEENVVSIGNDGSQGGSAYTRRLVNMAAGVADTDAVNVGQMRDADAALKADITNLGIDNQRQDADIKNLGIDNQRQNVDIKNLGIDNQRQDASIKTNEPVKFFL